MYECPGESIGKKSIFDITVVDDGSTDETVEMLEIFKARTELKLQWTTIKNSGPATARNAGVAITSGPWIGFLDADVIPHPDWVDTALELIRSNPKAGAFEGRTEVTPARSGHTIYTSNGKYRRRALPHLQFNCS